jgi:hypothetical protein
MNKSFEIVQTEFGNFLVNEYDLIGINIINRICTSNNISSIVIIIVTKVEDKQT